MFLVLAAMQRCLEGVTSPTDKLQWCHKHQSFNVQQCTQEVHNTHVGILASLIPQLFMNPWEHIFLLIQSLFDVAEH